MRTLIATVFLGISLSGCQPQPITYDVPESRSFSQDVDTIWPQVLAFLDRNSLDLVEENQAQGSILAIRAAYQDQGWAVCKPARVIDRHDDKNRRDRGRPVSRDLRLQVRVLAGNDGTVVEPKANFTEEQINPFRNLPFTTRCRSNGTLENALFKAIDESL
jgi:hypothetical protein